MYLYMLSHVSSTIQNYSLNVFHYAFSMYLVTFRLTNDVINYLIIGELKVVMIPNYPCTNLCLYPVLTPFSPSSILSLLPKVSLSSLHLPFRMDKRRQVANVIVKWLEVWIEGRKRAGRGKPNSIGRDER